MNNNFNFYDNLDLKYPEIGIAIQDIDRQNPGLVKFIIPILTPNMDNSKKIDSTIYQNSQNLKNSKKNIEIESIKICNYINIPIPKELCSLTQSFYPISFDIKMYTSYEEAMRDKDKLLGSGYADSFGLKMYTSYEDAMNDNNSGDIFYPSITENPNRYIKSGSKWIIVFVGGDITKPRVIAPYEE